MDKFDMEKFPIKSEYRHLDLTSDTEKDWSKLYKSKKLMCIGS